MCGRKEGEADMKFDGETIAVEYIKAPTREGR
jgi:hypothetical protein